MVDVKKMEKTHIAVTAIYALRDVTICLYLSPNNRARSLSTLIAVSVKKRRCAQNTGCGKIHQMCVVASIPSFVHHGHQVSDGQGLCSDANAEIGCR